VRQTRTRGNREGDVYPTKDRHGKTRYAGVYYVFDPATGKSKPKYVTAKEKSDAKRKLQAARKKIEENGGVSLAGENITLAEYINTRWFPTLATRNLKASTVAQYRRTANNHILPNVGGVKLADLIPDMLQDLYDQKAATGLSPSAVRQIYVLLHSVLGHAYKRGVVRENVARKVDAPKVRAPKIEPLDREEVHALLGALKGDKLEALYVLLVTAGLRIGEALALRWQEFDTEGGTLRVARTLTRAKSGDPERFTTPKNGKGRNIILTAPASRALRAHRVRQNAERLAAGGAWEDHGLIFTSRKGTALTTSNLEQRSLRPLLKRAGVREDVSFHDFRHTCATLLLGQGMNPKFVQELLGHANVSITLDRYSHWVSSMGDGTARAMERALGL
jgi:integrase